MHTLVVDIVLPALSGFQSARTLSLSLSRPGTWGVLGPPGIQAARDVRLFRGIERFAGLTKTG